jgi:hypothetical protein
MMRESQSHNAKGFDTTLRLGNEASVIRAKPRIEPGLSGFPGLRLAHPGMT